MYKPSEQQINPNVLSVSNSKTGKFSVQIPKGAQGGMIVVKIDSSINTMKLTRIDWLLASLLLTLSGLAFQVFARLWGLEAWMAKSRFASTNSDKFHI